MSNQEPESAHSQSAIFDEMTSEQKLNFFAQIGLENSQISPDGYEFFAFVVDGVVSVIFIASKESMQKEIIAWSSNPTIVKLTPEQKNVVLENWIYDSETGEFSQPE
jgi:hypothetical protein